MPMKLGLGHCVAQQCHTTVLLGTVPCAEVAVCTNAPSIRRGEGAGPGAWPGPGDRAGSRAGFLSYICSAVVS